MSERLKRLIIIAAALAATFAGCAQQPSHISSGNPKYGVVIDGTGKVANAADRGCQEADTAMQCEMRQPAYAANAAAAEEQRLSEQRARAECNYETTANMTNFRGGILMDIATRNNLYNLCMQAKGSTSH